MNIKAIQKALEELRQEAMCLEDAARNSTRATRKLNRLRSTADKGKDVSGSDDVRLAGLYVGWALSAMHTSQECAAGADYALGDTDAALGLAPSWFLAPDWANWRAQDYDGEWYWHAKSPDRSAHRWFCDGPYFAANMRTDPTNWRDSLSQRPEALRDGVDQ